MTPRAAGTAEQALRYAAHGWPVFPCQPGSKQPATTHGFLDATTDPDKVTWWWRRQPDANLAIATGHPGPDVLDVDQHGPAGNGYAAFNKLQRAGLIDAASAIVATPSGGLHAYFTGSDQRCGKLTGHHLDFRGHGGYVLAPPSQVDGRAYQVIRHRDACGGLDWAKVTSLLQPQRSAGVRPAPVRRGNLSHLAAWVQEQQEGNRNDGLFWAACRAAEAGDEMVLAEVADAARATGLPDREIAATIASARRAAGRPFEHQGGRDGRVMTGPSGRIDANGTMWRLRSLVAMGHDSARIARALDVSPVLVRRVVRGQARTITAEFHAAACQLWDAWWDKTPLARTPAQRAAAARALRQAARRDWPAAAGLEEDLLDSPGYRPWCRYRSATGTGTAPDFPPSRPRLLHARREDRMTTTGPRRAAGQAARPDAASELPPAPRPGTSQVTVPDGDTLRAELPADLTSARHARAAIRQALAAWRMDHLSGDAELLASELVANAAEHGGGQPIGFALYRHTGPGGRPGITCEVTDTSPAMPGPAYPGPDAERGRGLAIVAALAQTSGVRATEAGKTTWFTLALTDRAHQIARQVDHEPEAGA